MANGRARPRRAACKSRTWRWACARLAEQLQPTRTQVLDDSSHVQLAPDRRFHGTVAYLLQPERLPRLIQKQAEILAIVIAEGMVHPPADRGGQGAAQLSIVPEGPASLSRDISETLALLLS